MGAIQPARDEYVLSHFLIAIVLVLCIFNRQMYKQMEGVCHMLAYISFKKLFPQFSVNHGLFPDRRHIFGCVQVIYV